MWVEHKTVRGERVVTIFYRYNGAKRSFEVKITSNLETLYFKRLERFGGLETALYVACKEAVELAYPGIYR